MTAGTLAPLKTEEFAGHSSGPWSSRVDSFSHDEGMEYVGYIFSGAKRIATLEDPSAADLDLMKAAPALLADRDRLAGRVAELEAALQKAIELTMVVNDDFITVEIGGQMVRTCALRMEFVRLLKEPTNG